MQNKRKTLKDRLQRRRSDTFVGRESQLQLFQQNLERQPEHPEFCNIFNVHGQGGIGKSTLLNKYIEMAKGRNALTCYTDEGIRSVLEWMNRVSKQLEQQGAPLEKFDKHFKAYRQQKQQLETDPEAPKGTLSFFTKTLTKGGLKAIRRIPGSEMVMEFADDEGIATQVGEWADHIRKKITNKDEVQLVMEPEAVLTPLFLEDLFEYAEKRRICFCIDTYENTGIFMDGWLRNLLEGNYGDASESLMFLIAGRDPLDPNNWSDFSSLSQAIPLKEFTDEEARKYLQQQNITSPELIQSIITISGRLPVLLTALADIAPESAENLGDISDTAIDRFLRWVDDPLRRRVALNAALARRLNQDILAVIAPEGNAAELFDWLRKMPFVQMRGEHWTYHPIVREQMLTNQRRRSDSEWAEMHGKLATFYEAKQQELGISERAKGFEDSHWRDLALEITYHKLEAESEKYLATALDDFALAWDVLKIDSIREWALVFPIRLVQNGKQTWQDLLQKGIAGYEEENYEMTINCFQELTKLLPENHYGWNAIGWAWFRKVDYNKAIKHFRKAADLKPENPDYWQAIGIAWYNMEDYEKAMEFFQKAAEIKPDNPIYWNNIGNAWFRKEDYDKAIEFAKKAAELKPDDPTYWNNIGWAWFSKEDYDKAIEFFLKATELKPDDPVYWNNIGDSWCNKGDYDKAIEFFLKTTELKPDDPIYWNNIGRAWYNKEDDNRAIEFFQKAADLKSDDPTYWNNIGWAWYGKKDYDKAIEFFQKATDLKPHDPTYWNNIGWAWYGKKDYDKAIKFIQKAADLKPDDPVYWNNLGDAWYYKEDYDKAIEFIQKAADLKPHDPTYWNNIGRAWYGKKDYDKAIEFFQKAADLKPDHPTYWNNIGWAWNGKKDYNKAIEFSQKAADLKPEEPTYWNNVGDAWYYKEDYDKAIEFLQKAADLKPDDPTYWNNIGRAWYGKEDFDKAIEFFQKAADLKPDDPTYWNNIGWAWYGKDDFDKAMEFFPKAADLKPDDPTYWNNIGWAWYGKEDYDKAMELYQKAADLKPDEPVYWDNVGWAWYNKEEYDKAIKFFQKAADLNPDYPNYWDNIGKAYRKKGEYSKAHVCHNKSLDLKPDYYEALGSIALTYLMEGNLEMAEEAASQEVNKTAPKNISYALLRLATVLLAKGIYDVAVEKFNEATNATRNKNKFFKDAMKYWEFLEPYPLSKEEFSGILEAVKGELEKSVES
jgi:tetratricopeptide (TPR) repeat protein